MPTRTSAKKGAKKSAKKGAKKAAGKKAGSLRPDKIPGKGPHPLYGRPIDEAIRRGNVAEMRRVAAQARKYLKEVQAGLAALERKIGRNG